ASSLAVPWSPRSYGPDGPWQAVIAAVGGDDIVYDISTVQTTIDLLPGGYWPSSILQSTVCINSSQQLACGRGGTWDPVASFSSRTPDVNSFTFSIGDLDPGVLSGEHNGLWPQAMTVKGLNMPGNQTVYNGSLSSVAFVSIANPDGSTRLPQLGYFSLGAPSYAQLYGTDPDFVVPIFISGLHEQKIIPSNSFGLQIGSAPLGYSGSLVLGGYDNSRLIGPYTTWTYNAKGDPAGGSTILQSIGFGVESGGQPFDFDPNENYLVSNNNEISPMSVKILPATAYMVLPNATCVALSRVLPIYFNSTIRYWLWNTTHPSYEKAITSPSYLSFSFPHSNPPSLSGAPVVIKVPLMLLNLTLDAGIVDTPTPYFPCLDIPSDYRLGRAFLQAAFFGCNHNTTSCYLAQAPGPGVTKNGLAAPNYVDIQNDDRYPDENTLVKDPNAFNESWAGVWTALPGLTPTGTVRVEGAMPTNTNTATETHTEPQGLSTGAKAGIGVGASLGALSLAALAAFLLVRRKRR
ncbi:hypothetical protein K402DRAFT_305470, partial [Aulographum hederae CBS 113979]